MERLHEVPVKFLCHDYLGGVARALPRLLDRHSGFQEFDLDTTHCGIGTSHRSQRATVFGVTPRLSARRAWESLSASRRSRKLAAAFSIFSATFLSLAIFPRGIYSVYRIVRIVRLTT